MHTEKGFRKSIKFLCFICLFLTFISFGCKAKEEKQTPVGQHESVLPEQKEDRASSITETTTTGRNAPIIVEKAANTPPRITSLDIKPRFPVPGDTIKVYIVAFDKERDDVTYSYEWSKNDSILSEESSTLVVSEDFKRGDKIDLRVIPDDGKTKGNPLSVVIIVANSLPVIESSEKTFRFDGNSYSYQVKANDPDGDSLAYTLKSAPADMTINQATGLIEWNVPAEFKGKVPIIVSITDGHGGEVIQSSTLEIR